MDGRGCGAAVAIAAGILLGGSGAVAYASPDTEASTDAGPARPSREAPSGRGSVRSAAPESDRPARRGIADTSRAEVADLAVPPDPEPAAIPVDVPDPVVPVAAPAVTVDVAVPEAIPPAVSDSADSPPPPSVTLPAPVPLPDPPRLAAAASATAGGAADPLAEGSGTPLPSALAWTMLAAARSEVGRRSPAAAVPVQSTSDPLQPVGQAVSPLGTPQQTAAEAAAMDTVHTLPVLLTKAVLGLAWRVIGCIEYAQVGGPDQANIDALGAAVDEWAMASAFQSMILNSNEPEIVMQVAPPHQWYGLDVAGSRILYDNPDTIYRFTGVNYASQYVITGRMPENPGEATFSVLTGLTGTTAAVLDASTLELGPDRTFVLTVSGEPAAPGEKNHLQITPDTTLIAIRDTLADWNIDEPMALAIQRVAGPPPSLFGQFGGFAIPFIGPLVAQSELLTALVSVIPPLPFVPPFVQGSIASLLMLRGISEESKYITVATTDPMTGKPKGPNVFTDPTSNASFLATQLQSTGYFQLADDQALVLTITPNSAGYFVAPVTDDWTITDNYWDEQTSLNSSQAKANPDGSYTLVVSSVEPRLADGTSPWNWVSTGGLNQGTMAIRFQRIDLTAPVGPSVRSEVVSLSDVGSVLPAGTVSVTPAERAVQIAARGQGFNRRFAPYPQTV